GGTRGGRVSVRGRVAGQRGRDGHGESRRGPRAEQPVEEREVFVRHGELRQGQGPVGRTAHVQQRVLLSGVHQNTERASAAQQVGDVVRELLHTGPGGRIRVTERGEHAAEEIALARRIGGGHGRAVVVPHERWHAGHGPRALHAATVEREAVRRAGVDAYHRSCDGDA